MPMPPDTLNTPQDLDSTGARAIGSEQQQRRRPQEDDNTQYYEQAVEKESHGSQLLLQQQQLADTIHYHTHHTAIPDSAVLQAQPPEQPHLSPFYPPALDDQLAFDAHGAIPIDPVLLDARFGPPAASGNGGGGGPGFHQGQPEYHWAAAPQQLSSANMDNLMASPASLPPYNDPLAPFLPGMTGFEPQLSTTWSMDESLPSTSTSRGPAMSSSLSLPDTSTPASSKSPGSPRKAAAGLNNQTHLAGKDAALARHPGMQLEPRVGDEPSKKRRQTVGPQATAWDNTENLRSSRNNSSPGFSTPHVAIAPAPIPAAATGDDNNSIHSRKGSSIGSNNNNSPGLAERTKKTTTAPMTTTKTTTTPQTSNAAGPSPQPQPGAPTTTADQPPDPRARNRQAANRSRAKSKRAEAELEAVERALGSEHERLTRTARSLHDEVLDLKTEVLAHGNCGDELIEQYLTNSARLVGSGASTVGAAVGAAAAAATTTTAFAGGVLRQPPGTAIPSGPSLGGAGGIDGSSRAVLSTASPPRVLPLAATAPSSLPAAPVAGQTTTKRNAKSTGGRGEGSTGGQTP
ncbi:hypothetical protein KVR01_007655 [Diaporthe batatas]|uniref:uncharacterized protein n=1 Tax=Diaporthe batatas TaxID=748121 RepID=UPI001D046263|nr:uncharacterized protein KVR01_007655 [Diaporthe batatas]KAG8163177.1 hypothetical protein KVR01_007655 [Diaporthe batatas]